jgi:hypothetical protein
MSGGVKSICSVRPTRYKESTVAFSAGQECAGKEWYIIQKDKRSNLNKKTRRLAIFTSMNQVQLPIVRRIVKFYWSTTLTSIQFQL